MFNRHREESKLDLAIDQVFADLEVTTSDDPAYRASMKQLVKLYALKDRDVERRISPDTWLVVSANLLGIVIVVTHERTAVITTKALNFVMKMK